MDGSGNISPNDIVLFTVTVSNAGPSNATGVGVGDLLPSGYSNPTNISHSGTFAGGIVSWSGLSVFSGGSQVLTFRATVNATGNYTNVAEVTASDQFDPDSQPDPTPDNDPPAQDDEASFVPPGSAAIGDSVWFDYDGDGIQDSRRARTGQRACHLGGRRGRRWGSGHVDDRHQC